MPQASSVSLAAQLLGRYSLSLVVGLVLAVTLVAVWDDTRLREEQRATLHQLNLTGEAEADATRQLYRSYVEQARANRLSGRLGRRVESLKVLDKAARSPAI